MTCLVNQTFEVIQPLKRTVYTIPFTYFTYLLHSRHPALQAATILVAMASGKNIWQLKFWRNANWRLTDLKRNLLEKLSKIPDEFNQ